MARTLIRMKTKSLGDTLGASPYFEEYRKKTGDEVYVSCNLVDFFQPIYPFIKFIPFGFKNSSLFDKVFDVGFLFDAPLQKGFSDQLGLEYREIRPSISFKTSPRPFEERYVCIAMQSTCQSRYWNNPGAWEKLFNMLKKEGITPICIDQYSSFGVPGFFNNLPSNCVDRTGLSLDKTIEYIENCEFLIGLSTGLTWLAHSMGKHTVIISGSTHEWCEPTTDTTRVINKEVCHGCFNEPEKTPFDASDWLWCPHKKSTQEEFICSKSISAGMVWELILNQKLINK
jgi:autotransporter strand-loop-strand O-heptosyltransferase